MPTILIRIFWYLAFYALLSEVSISANAFPGPRKRVIATVLVFLDTECPISQQYTRPLETLYQQYVGKGVDFQAIFPASTDTQATIAAFKKTYSLHITGQSDPARTRVRQYRAQVTPEVVVLSQQGAVLYQGAIDDWFVALGKHRREPTQFYLRDALEAILTNKPLTISRTEPVGCRIQL